MEDRFIPIGAPTFIGNEESYVLDAVKSTWVSSIGKYIERFEEAFAEFCGTKRAVSCSNGTTALHLALMALGVGPGDEVIVPTLTFVATANTVTYCGARPVFVDCEDSTWQIDPALIEAKITPRTKGIIVVHLYGHPVDMDPVLAIARRHGLFVLEDAAQSHGAEYKGRKVGSIGDVATFSFFGNKIITTGEGGMVVTNDESMVVKMNLLKNHGMDPNRRYWFPVIGYNYRMTNVAAAIGLAQLEKIEWHLQRRREIASWYREDLAGANGLTWQGMKKWAKPTWWMVIVVLDDKLPVIPDEVITYLRKCGIEARPVGVPIHTLPPYLDSSQGLVCPIAERLSRRGVNLPTWGGLTREDVRRISRSLLECLRGEKIPT